MQCRLAVPIVISDFASLYTVHIFTYIYDNAVITMFQEVIISSINVLSLTYLRTRLNPNIVVIMKKRRC